MKLFILFLSFFVVFSKSDNIIPLNSIPSGDYQISNYNLVGIYISASSDDPDVLRRLTVVDGYGSARTALEILRNKPFGNSDLTGGWITVGPVFVKPSLEFEEIDDLKGFIFIKERKPSDYSNFFVYDLSQSNQVILSKSIYPKNVVILNTLTSSSSKIENWTQSNTTQSAIYLGSDSGSQRIFKNPMDVPQFVFPLFIASVQPFSLDSRIFSFTVKGDSKFTISPGSVDLKNYTTTSASSTGILPSNANVTFLKNVDPTKRFGISGFMGPVNVANYPVIIDLVTADGVHHPTNATKSDFQFFYTNQLAQQISMTQFEDTKNYIQYFNYAF